MNSHSGDVTSSTRLNYAEYDNFSDRRKGQHYESCEEDSGFDDRSQCSGHNTSDGRESPEIKEGLSLRKQPMKLSKRKLLVKKTLGKEELSIRKQPVKLSKRKLLVKMPSGKKTKLKGTVA